MKKIATVLAAAVTLAFAVPAFACPHGEQGKTEEKTAAPKKEQPKTDAPKTATPKTDAPKKTPPKTADSGKVSSK